MPIVLPEAVRRDVDNAFAEGHPIVVAGVTRACEPTVSFRGAAQTLGAGAIAFWSRDPDASTLAASLDAHPVVALVYSNMAERRFYQFTGRARLNDAPDVDRAVYDGWRWPSTPATTPPSRCSGPTGARREQPRPTCSRTPRMAHPD